MNSINFKLSNPLANADADQPEDLFTAIKAEERWSEHSLRWTEDILIEWTVDAFNTPNNRETREELHRLIKRIPVIQNPEEQDKALRETVRNAYLRWEGIAALYAADAHREHQHPPKAVEQRTHMPTLKALLTENDAPLPVGQLPEKLGLSASRVSQLLSLAQAASLVRREKKNGQRVVSLAGEWLKASAPEVESAVPATEEIGQKSPSTAGNRYSTQRGTSALTIIKKAA